ncbi:hypothetical protein HC891_17615, partial [Candidatus Gracilibacteria bacterium]|nr:hypothetical protein [Candidatus Gracilibacteria bacterium]
MTAIALPGRSATSDRPWYAPLFFCGLFVLALLALTLGHAVIQPSETLVVGTAVDRRALVRFHEIELQGATAFRWSEPQAAVFLYGFDGRPALVTLRLAAARPPELSPVTLTIRSEGAVIGNVPVGVDWRRYHLLVPTNRNGDTPVVLETAEFSAGGDDTRLIGVALSAVASRFTVAAGLFPPFVRSVFLLSLPLIAALGIWRWRRNLSVAAAVTLPLLLLVVWAAAYPALAGYWLPTLLWPGWPLIPLLLLAGWPWFVRAGRGAIALVQGRCWLSGCGAVVALLALCGVWLGLPLWLAVVGVLGGTLLALAARAGGILGSGTGIVPVAVSRGELLAVAAISALALGLRFVNLGEQPLGLWRDEARHGLLALQIWQEPSFRPIYVVEGADLPALLFYLMAPLVGLFGPELWTARFTSALAGALTPLALWWAVRPLLGP